jgi:hypothetical protein
MQEKILIKHKKNDSINISKVINIIDSYETISVKISKKIFFFEIFAGFIIIFLYILVCSLQKIKILPSILIILIIISIFFIMSAILKKKRKSFKIMIDGISNSKTKILWSDVIEIQEVEISNYGITKYRFNILRIITAKKMIDFNLEELNYKKEIVIDKLIHFWQASQTK